MAGENRYGQIFKHLPNLCIAQKVCNLCERDPVDDHHPTCNQCKDRQKIFEGENTADDFCRWLFGGSNKGCIAIAHNAKGTGLEKNK